MSYRELLSTLEAIRERQKVDVFGFLASLASFTARAERDVELQQARDVLVRMLEQRDVFARYEPAVQAMLQNVGLYPYLRGERLGIAAQIATEAHRPEAMPEHIVFTTKQAEVYRELMAGRNVVLSAPTSFGKSLIIDAVIASQRHRNIVIVVPTLALVDETRRRLMRFRPTYKVITHLGQAPGDRNVFVHTQERVVENKEIRNVDFFVIDEFYKLEIEDNDESDERGILLNKAFYQLVNQAKQFYMLGPNIRDLPKGFGENYQCTFIRTEFSTVASETHLVPAGATDSARLGTLVKTLQGPTLIFSGSVGNSRKFGRVVAYERGPFQAGRELKQAIDWLGRNYSPDWSLVECLSNGVGIHHGRLPRSIAQLLVRLFNEEHIDFLVCTSTLIEGVNTAARNVVIADNKIAKTKYDYFTFNNIRGRSGRMWRHFIGHVYLFHQPPQPELDIVDVPVFTQGDSAPDALLVQLDLDDLVPSASDRIQRIFRQDYLSVETIRENVGLDPNAQIVLAREIQERLGELRPLLSWDGLPTYDQLGAVFELAWRHFKLKPGGGAFSAKQLTLLVHRYRMQPSYAAQLQAAIRGKSGGETDEALENFLEFARQWLSFKAPRIMGAVGKIQDEVLSRNRVRPGNYKYFCGQMESLFMNPVIGALEEYGVPLQLAERVVVQLGSPSKLDDALSKLEARPITAFRGLSAFERSLVEPLCNATPDEEDSNLF